ncbi:DUF4124 domain-containing protein [Lysobacter korlensis]|uniref:DUF4124 domain-containing protein n=1 Tax=Lysobacter korlensis TaxID=553636 RepID=A0ABV6RLP5_9GAMM
MNRVPRRAPIRRLCWLAVGLLLALPASASKIYQWKDAKGVTHYTDLPPDQKHTTRKLGGQRETPAVAAKPVVNANCTNARGNLKVLQGSGPVGLDADKDGKPDGVMSPEQRAAQVQLAQAAINVHCEASPISASAAKTS